MNAIYRLDVKDSFHIIVFCFYILQNIQKEITNPTAIRSICANIQIYMDLQPNITSGGTFISYVWISHCGSQTKRKDLLKRGKMIFLLLCCRSNFLAMFHISLTISLRHPNSRSISEMKIVEPILLSLVNLMDKTLTVFLTKHFIAGNKFHT